MLARRELVAVTRGRRRGPRSRGTAPLATAGGALAAALLLAAGCRPDSVTGARDQLSRGDAREVSYRVPLAREQYGAGDFLRSATVRELAGELVGVALPVDTLESLPGPRLAAGGEAALGSVRIVDADDVELGEMGDALAGARVMSAPLEVTLRSTSAAPLRLVDPALGLVRLEGDGTPARDASGRPVLLDDDSGRPLRVPLAGTEGDSLLLPPGGGAEAEADAAPLVDRLVDRAASGRPTGVGLLGLVRVHPDDLDLVAAADSLLAAYRAWAGLELVLPDSGVVVSRQLTGAGLGLPEEDVAQVRRRVIRAGATLAVENELPFALRVVIAYAPADRRAEDVFGAPDAVILDPLAVGPGAGAGPPADSLEISLTGEETGALLRDAFAAGVRIRLLPAGRPDSVGAIRIDELVDVDARAFLDVRASEGS